MPFAKTPGSWKGGYELASWNGRNPRDLLHVHCPLDNHLDIGASAPARHSLGKLDELPDEILVLVLISTDIPYLTVFRRVNRRAMQTVNSIRQYDAIIRQCPDIIRAILAVGASTFDLNHLYKTLKDPKCFSCSDDQPSGANIYLISCRRVCIECMLRRPEYLPCTLDDNAESEELQRHNQQMQASYPSILSLPYKYQNHTHLSEDVEGPVDERVWQRRIRLFDREAVGQEAGYTPDRPEDDELGKPGWCEDLNLRSMATFNGNAQLY